MKVRFSRAALNELDAILTHIASRDPRAAARFALRLQGMLRRVEQFPEGAQAVAERPDIRRVPLVRYPYAVYYKAFPDEIMILRILHSARRQPWEEP